MQSADAAVLVAANNYTNSQIAAVVINVAGFEDKLDAFELQVAGLDKRVDQVGAMSAAMAQMTAAASGNDKDNRLAVGLGNYGGQTAFALGFQRTVSDNVTISFGAAFDGDKTATGAGASFGW
jgi:trimeric autotransporter adhesin